MPDNKAGVSAANKKFVKKTDVLAKEKTMLDSY